MGLSMKFAAKSKILFPRYDKAKNGLLLPIILLVLQIH